MRAIVQFAYGGPERLELREVERPEIGPEQVLVRVEAASVNPLDYHAMRGRPPARLVFGLRRPKRPVVGTDVAGVVEAVGAQVEELAPGDAVHGVAAGAFAELAPARAKNIVRKPERLSFEQAAALPLAGLTALQALRHAGLRAGEHIAITGATGGIGHFAVQIAKAWGAEVTGTCRPENEELLRSLGADHVVVYTRDDYLRRGPYDVILDNGGGRSLRSLRRALAPGGRAVPNCGSDVSLILATLVWSRLSDEVVWFMTRFDKDDLRELDALVEEGKLTPVVGRTYPLAEAADALRHLGGRHPRGKIVVAV